VGLAASAGKAPGRSAECAVWRYWLVAWLAWLVGDACRRKLAGAVLGNEQERALAKIADWAIRATASELAPGTGKDTASLARDIGQVFNPPDLGELASAGGTLLEAISAGITGRVAVLGDRDITGTGLSYSEITGSGGRRSRTA
jgi:hypothetical protein